jgi:hypothetical protein
LDQAVAAGYLHRWRWGHGRGNRRWNYQATLPRGEIVTEDHINSPVIVIENNNKPCPSLTLPKESRAPEPAVITLSTAEKIKTTPPDGLPERWIETAHQLRPELSPATITASAARFIDYHRAKGTILVDWLPAWRNWIRQERVSQPASHPEAHPATPALSKEEQDMAYQARIDAADQRAEARRQALLVARGIEEKTPVAKPDAACPDPVAKRGLTPRLVRPQLPTESTPRPVRVAPPMTLQQQRMVLELRVQGATREEAIAVALRMNRQRE